MADRLQHLLGLVPIVSQWAKEHNNHKAHFACTALLLKIHEELTMPEPKEMRAYFNYAHLPPHLQKVSKLFADLVEELGELEITDPREFSVALRKLLEAKDAAVRSVLP